MNEAEASTLASPLGLPKDRRALIREHATSHDGVGLVQALTLLGALAALWWAIDWSASVSYWLTGVFTVLITLFLVRGFVLMHDCGHGSLFHTRWLNRTFGFAFGVLSGMPQYVWSKHHAYHHATNGNWAKYRGPLVTASVQEFEALSGRQQRLYERLRTVWLVPLGGFLYVLFNPRYTWLRGSLDFLVHVLRGKRAADFKTAYWASAREYWHMLGNNVVLLGACAAMSWLIGPALFFPVYVASVSLAGGVGIALFTVQHNFEHSYASGDEGWDEDAAALSGSSFLVLPRWLNWFTADIAYHHVHHLSAAIPNYRLAACHAEHADLFVQVPRLRLADIPAAFKCNLWDTRARRIISVAEYRAAKA